MSSTDPILDFARYVQGGESLREASQSVRALKRDVTAFSKAVGQDAEKIKAGMETVAQAIKAIRDKGGNLNMASEADRQSLRELIKEMARLKAEQDRLRQSGADVATTQRTMREATGLYTKELKEQREALKKAYEVGDLEGLKRASRSIQALNQDAQSLTKALRGQKSEFTAAKGSYDAADQALQKYRAELRALEDGLAGTSPRAKELTSKIQELDFKLKASDATMGQAYRNVGNYTQSILTAVRVLEQEKAALTQAAAALRTQAQATGLSAEQQNKLQAELKQTDAALDKVNGELKGFGVTTEGAGGSLKKYILTAGLALISFQSLGAAAQTVFRNNVEYSDQLADVRKTTGLTADESDRLAESLKKINTRTSLAGLLDIAKVGGQLGIAKGDILDFTKAVDVAVQALGDDFQGGAEQIATELGKIANVFRRELGPDVAQNLTAIGSAVNEIGAEGAATAPFLTDVALRVGAVSAQTGVGLKNVLAYAAVLEETGFSSERAGTALNRLFSTLSTKTEESFRIAQKANPALTLKEFTRLVNTDFNQAVQLFLKGLNAGGKTTTALNASLATLKLQSGEAKNVIITLAQNTELFAQRQATANEQLRDATSLAEEAAIKNNNLAGSWSKLTNDVSNFFTSGTGAAVLKFLVDAERDALKLTFLPFKAIGDGLAYIGEKTGALKKEQKDYVAVTVEAIKTQQKQAAAQQKLLDAYTALSGKANRSALEELQLARAGAKLQAEFGSQYIPVIKDVIAANKEKSEKAIAGLRSELNYYDKQFLPGLQQRAAEAQTAVTALGVGPNKDREKLQAKQLEAEQRLTRETARRAAIAATLGKLVTQTAKAATDATDENTDAEEANTVALDRNAKARAERRKTQLEGELAGQQRLIEETKRLQAAQFALFEAKAINEDVYAKSVAGTNDVILDAERKSADLRVRIAAAGRDAALAQVDNEVAAVRNKKKVGDAEVQDAERAAANNRLTIREKFKQEAIKIEQQLADSTRTLVESIANRPIGLSPEVLAKADRDLDLSGERRDKKLQELGERNRQRGEREMRETEEQEDRKRRLREATIDFAIQAEQAFFEFQAQRNYAAIESLQAAKEAELKTLGDNEEAKIKVAEAYDNRIRAAKRKAAQDDKTAALFQVAISTAQAVARTFAEFGFPFGIPFAALAVGAGALQAGLIASQPLPQYFKGRESGPAEWAVVAERGPELIEGRSGGMQLVEKPSLIYLEQNDKVLTAQKTQAYLRASAEGVRSAPAFGESLQVVNQQFTAPASTVLPFDSALQGQTRELAQVLERLPEQTASALVRKRRLLQDRSLADAIAARLRSVGR